MAIMLSYFIIIIIHIIEDEYLEKTHELLIKAVDKRMLAADVPIGVLLSGGLDSSTTA
jgi:asparagine synthase (glutamine-hydrolysing)